MGFGETLIEVQFIDPNDLQDQFPAILVFPVGILPNQTVLSFPFNKTMPFSEIRNVAAQTFNVDPDYVTISVGKYEIYDEDTYSDIYAATEAGAKPPITGLDPNTRIRVTYITTLPLNYNGAVLQQTPLVDLTYGEWLQEMKQDPSLHIPQNYTLTNAEHQPIDLTRMISLDRLHLPQLNLEQILQPAVDTLTVYISFQGGEPKLFEVSPDEQVSSIITRFISTVPGATAMLSSNNEYFLHLASSTDVLSPTDTLTKLSIQPNASLGVDLKMKGGLD